jgi:hypothetical protein
MFLGSSLKQLVSRNSNDKKQKLRFIDNCIITAAKLRKKLVKRKRFWKINAFRPEIKAKRGRTWKFKNRDNAKLGGLVKEIGCQIVTQFMTLGTRKVPLQNSEE